MVAISRADKLYIQQRVTKMNKNIIALTVLMALSATAQAEMVPSNNSLNITGKVLLEGCAFEDGKVGNKSFSIELPEVSLASVLLEPTTILKSTGGDSATALVCPPGIKTVDMSFAPTTAFEKEVLLNNKAIGSGGADGVGIKVKAGFSNDATTLDSMSWIDFSNTQPITAAVTNNRVDMVFGANYALNKDISLTSAGDVEVELPFTITYQ